MAKDLSTTASGSVPESPHLELGLDTFGDVLADSSGQRLSQGESLRRVVEHGVLADELGLSYFGVGEHHRPDYAVSSPEIVLAAIAARTQNIHLGSAVTVLSSDDPVRVYEHFATLDGLSNGRAEVTLGRGSFIESFPLFGYDLEDYNELFEEKLELFSLLRKEEPVTWQGTMRKPLSRQMAYPVTESGSLTTWVGVGGSPESVVRTARYGFNLMLAIIGGDAARFRPYVDLYHRSLAEFGQPTAPVGVHSPGFVAPTDKEAIDFYWPYYESRGRIMSRERGWPEPTFEHFLAEMEHGAHYVGSPETVATKIAATAKTLGLSRFNLKYNGGPMPDEELRSSIELYAREVAPLVQEKLA
ncbi:LLM class flavin-dependent oxidoreductase [Haematomicrobium sanguinis]|uniref:LLM class flavin-dependent oxidoreductase n=1 Tax=Haematomicrobium sanguinis TaxID=479106 RepID=UPI00068B5ACD|nr:LLM class flavin-dependent oxidoreductase [Haematomicrobium sanguinis]